MVGACGLGDWDSTTAVDGYSVYASMPSTMGTGAWLTGKGDSDVKLMFFTNMLRRGLNTTDFLVPHAATGRVGGAGRVGESEGATGLEATRT
jgi:hypothetical protein